MVYNGFIVLDAVFIIVFDWGVVGAASATVIGQVFSALFGTYLVFGKKTQVTISKNTFHLEKALCLQAVPIKVFSLLSEIITVQKIIAG